MSDLRIFTIDELEAIIVKHQAWLNDDDDGERADLSSADLSSADLRYANLRYANLSSADLSSANLILIGQDIRDYLFYGFKNDDDALVIRAGCRQFVGITAARQHWTERHTNDNILHEDCLSLVDRAERMAKVRGWKLEPEA